MANTHPPAKPPSPPPRPQSPPPRPEPARHEAAKHEPAKHEPEAARHREAVPIGAKPADPHDPQAIKFERHPAPPDWKEPKDVKERPAFTPEPALDPRAEKIPAGAYVDGMTIADEQRARAAWVEAHGLKAYHEATDDRTDEEREKKQVPGVVPPTKRE